MLGVRSLRITWAERDKRYMLRRSRSDFLRMCFLVFAQDGVLSQNCKTADSGRSCLLDAKNAPIDFHARGARGAGQLHEKNSECDVGSYRRQLGAKTNVPVSLTSRLVPSH